MKKLLLVLLALPLIGFGQTAEDYFNKAYDYAENEQYQLAIVISNTKNFIKKFYKSLSLN